MTRLELAGPAYLWEGPGISQTNLGSAGSSEFQELSRVDLCSSWREVIRWLVCFGFNSYFADRRGVALCFSSLCLDF